MPPETKPGVVRLVGAGPGAADLLTVRALRAVEAAQALLYDALVSDEVVALAPASCVRIQTGKRAGRPSMAQSTINRLMLRLARRGLTVVRLKGGDPSIFGRVGEELDFLHAHSIETEVVPGVTAASAAAAQFQFPLTHRGQGRRLLLTTGTLERNGLQPDWEAAADPATTVTIYMGASKATEIRRRLLAAGRASATPAMVVEGAGTARARAVTGQLADLDAMVAGMGSGPVLLVIGAVARGKTLWCGDLAREALTAASA